MKKFSQENCIPAETNKFDSTGGTNNIEWNLAAKTAAFIMKKSVKHYLNFTDHDVKALPEADNNKKYMLYLHVPFCLTLCPYCSFHRFKFHEETARQYFELLRQEMRATAKLGYKFGSAYFGGGTTSILPDELAKTIDLARELFDIDEVSCESDPNHIDEESLKYTKGRVDRLSVGIQTFNDKYLASIGRIKKFGTGAEQFEKVRHIIEHFPVVNLDLIFNLPGQTSAEFLEDIEKIKKLKAQQVTFYPLMYSPFVGKQLKDKIGKSSSENEAALYKIILDNMVEPYSQRTSWAFALKETNLIDEYVVDHAEYVGLGSGAFSFIKGDLYASSFSLKEYADRVSAGLSSAVKMVSFTNLAVRQYRMMVEMFGMNPYPSYKPLIEYNTLKLFGALKGNGEQKHLTPQGKFILSVMMKEFYNGMDYIRESMRSELKEDDERICMESCCGK